MMLENPAPTPPPPGTLNISSGSLGIPNMARQLSRCHDMEELVGGDFSYPEETLYMNRSNGRIQMYYESTDHLWDEETF